ncbi:ABC transporter G family member 21-like [Pecten maximus]|uniref:ABC transporter G family member 21-like n=1 Tax=Pecten maximus TaxID=6579 RepID=UPI00145807D7|nr:ABC transporter G family member 21-like [Pecten maximus]
MDGISNTSTLAFKDVTVAIKSKILLKNVSGFASSGDLLAIMGPTGVGKTTLLNVLAGRIPCHSGAITLNESPFNKALRRRLGYVLQNDIFLSNLTLWETLYFTAMIRLPDEIPKQEKIKEINKIVDSFDLQKCLNTAIGDIAHPGLSGGEKKRASIACELLAAPDILLIDEPTSGLDSSTAHSLMVQLRKYASEHNRTIVATIHQPSSQVFNLFSTLMLLNEGKMAYFGPANRAIEHYAGLGITCGQHQNPADFLLKALSADVIKHKNEGDVRGIQSQQQQEEEPKQSGTCGKHNGTLTDTDRGIGTTNVELMQVAVKLPKCHTNDVNNEREETRRWPTSLWTQFNMLSWRSYKQSKGRILDKFEILLAAMTATYVSVSFFQTENSASTVRDKMGLVMISLIYWAFRMFVMAILGFYDEQAVIRKDRAAGAYRLLAYYLAKITIEIPLIIFVPFLFNTAVYWLSGLGGVDGYLVFVGIGTLNCLLTQRVAHVLGAAIKDPKLGIMTGNVISIGGLVLGGFLKVHPHDWLFWMKYVTLFHYPYAATLTYILKDTPDVWCNQTNAFIYSKCLGNTTEVLTSRDLLIEIGVELPIYCYIMTIVFAILICYVIGYYALKWKRV